MDGPIPGEKPTADEKAIPEEKVDLSGIEWKRFTDEEEVQFVEGEPRSLTLTNWSQTLLYGAPAIRFEVTQEDGKHVKKVLTTKSKRLIRQLKPLMLDAFAEGKQTIRVSIIRTGSGYDTHYTVRTGSDCETDSE